MRLVYGLIAKETIWRLDGLVANNMRGLLKIKSITVSQVDGTVVIFDVETNGVARKLRGHTRQIQSLR